MFGQSPYTGFDTLRPLTDILTGPYCIQLVDYMNAKLSARPRTLTHGDLRADNIFRSNGLPVQDSKLTYIDWQLLQPGPPGPEFTQSWQHSLAPEIRRKDLDFLKAYHDRRVALAPQSANYSYENLVEDYRMAFILWWMALISLGAATIPVFDQPEGQRMKALWGQGLGYMFHAMQDHNCLDLVEQYLAEVK
jgi:aminoglycoside phosphotransferase (APT) family kinase protein